MYNWLYRVSKLNVAGNGITLRLAREARYSISGAHSPY